MTKEKKSLSLSRSFNKNEPLTVDSMSPLVLNSRKMMLESTLFVFNNFVISIKICGSSMSVK